MRQECCGKPFNTPFCPICGTKADSISSLLMYLEKELRLSKASQATLIEYLKTSDHYDRTKKRLDTATAKTDRLTGWLKWIKERNEQ